MRKTIASCFLILITSLLIPSCTQPVATPNPMPKYEITANEARTYLIDKEYNVVIAVITFDNTDWYGFKSLDESITTLGKWETTSEDIEVNAVYDGHVYFETFPDVKSAASWLKYIRDTEIIR